MRRALLALVLSLLACGSSEAPESEHLATFEAGTPAWHGDDAGAEASAPPSLCVDGGGAYPSATSMALLAAMPDLAFDGADAAGAPAKIAMHDFFEPCAVASRLLVLRVGATWCGTCQWHAAHTQELLSLDIGPRLEIVDVLVGDEDNMPAAPPAIAAWRARVDVPERIALDPSFAFAPLNSAPAPLPLYVLVDTRTMTIVNRLANPDPELLAMRLHQELAALDGVAPPSVTVPPKKDGRFTRDQWDMIHAMAAPAGASPPPDATNAHADDPAAASLGSLLFDDASLSPSGSISCGKCHDRGQQLAEGLAQSVGVAKVDRNAPSLTFAAWSRWQFWDGRADTLWMQALGPIENAKEMASSRLFVAHAIYDRHKSAYEAIFGAMPPLADTTRFPAAGKPGDASWTAMAAADRDAVTKVYVNAGKSIAAFERTIRAKPNALDAYAGGDLSALTTLEKNGLAAFFMAGCAQCHYGPRLTDDAFHAVRFPTGRQDGAADRGRIDGITDLLASDFVATGAFSDAPRSAYALTPAPATMLGAFKTPALRGVARTAPYGHGGTLATLADVAKNYSTAGLDVTSPLAVGVSEPWLPKFDDPTRDAIPAFLGALTADITP